MKEMDIFKRNAVDRNLCVGHAQMWANCKDNESLVKLSLRPSSIPYMAYSIRDGWGLSMDHIYDNFHEYINGEQVFLSEDDMCITSELYCKFNGDVDCFSDLYHFIGCNCNIYVPTTKSSTIHISNNSNVSIETRGLNHLIINIYDESNVNIKNTSDERVSVVVNKYSDDIKISYENIEIIRFKNRDIKIDAYGYGIYNE